MKTEINARLKYKIHHTRNMRRQNVTVQWHLYFAPITAIYRTHQAGKKTNKQEKRVQQPRGPYRHLRSAKGEPFC